MLGPDELPGGGSEDADRRRSPTSVTWRPSRRHSSARRTHSRTPYRVEESFQLELAGRIIRGRIDAVYRDTLRTARPTYEIVDWKTSRARTADPLQLAVYRLAWAEQQDVPLASVSAAFLYVRGGELVRPDGLPDRTGLERLLLGAGDPPSAG